MGGTWTALRIAVASWLVLGVGLGLSIVAHHWGTAQLGLSPTVAALTQAVVMAALVVPSIGWLGRRTGLSLADVGWQPRSGGRAVALGVGVGVATGLGAWAPAAACGWIRIDDVDWAQFGGS